MATVGQQRCRRDTARHGRLNIELTPLDRLVRSRIAHDGPLAYAEVVELALYHPEHGFYVAGGRAGRRGDFITSPEVGPLFGHLVANAIDAEWDRLGRPTEFTVVDFGAGPGTLARSVLSTPPRCAGAMHYIAVERSDEQRLLHPERITSVGALDADLVGDGLTGVVIANELLDNLAFSPVVRTASGLSYVEVVSTVDDALTTVAGSVVVDDDVFDRDAEAGVVQDAATAWLVDVLSAVSAGRVIVIDYARAASTEVGIRTFASHGDAGDPLVQLGTKDITVDVDLQQLQHRVAPATAVMSQADWLERHGLNELVEEGRATWHAQAAVGSLDALKARSRIREAEALTDPGGLGGFTVAEWEI